jgi:hypothetical protein
VDALWKRKVDLGPKSYEGADIGKIIADVNADYDSDAVKVVYTAWYWLTTSSILTHMRQKI